MCNNLETKWILVHLYNGVGVKLYFNDTGKQSCYNNGGKNITTNSTSNSFNASHNPAFGCKINSESSHQFFNRIES